ncbi:nuclease-related domain-containing protein [Streptomyces sp. NPDC049577]|uniref:nuclease-related domain-containing protein n=1 Tax=Streptomyces sp. NPDC049577 TaxID=3155153 RepID=UPI0034278942
MCERPEAKRGADGRPYDPDRLFLPPDDDLAPNRPGETLRARLDGSRTAGARLVLARLLGRRPVEDAWRAELAAEQLVGAELDALTPGGWEVVHSIVLPGDAVISHLLIGPGGVFCVFARPGRERQPQPHVRRVRQCAARASLALTRGCGFLVRVLPVLVLVGAGATETAADDVRLLGEGEVASLGTLGGVLHPDRVDRVHTVARNRRVWLGA